MMTSDTGGRGEPGHYPLPELRSRLHEAPDSYLLHQPYQNDIARFYFLGRFQDHEVIWDATLMTLEHFVQLGCSEGRYCPGETLMLQQFIHISDEDIEPLPIKIVHDIPGIDEARILKTIIMIRNYKRLHRGEHHYGEQQRFVIETLD